MAIPTVQVDTVSRLLNRLSEICDTGFALAVHIRYTRPSLLYRTYSQAWIDEYTEKGFMLSDPVVIWGLGHDEWVRWDDLAASDPVGVLTAARANGLHNGWTNAVGAASSRTISGFTKSGADFTPGQRAEMIDIVYQVHQLTNGIEAFSVEIMDTLRTINLQ